MGSRYESPRFKEHHETRIPLLDSLIEEGRWLREQIICPPSEREWFVPKTPSEAAKREAGRSFAGYPVDLAIFDSAENVGDWQHVEILIETKASHVDSGLSQLETYLGLEPNAKMGYWTNGVSGVRVYKLPDGSFEIERNARIPLQGENIIKASSHALVFGDLTVPTEFQLKSAFSSALNTIAAADSVSTRPEQRLNEVCNVILLKLYSDTLGMMDENSCLEFQLESDPEKTQRRINELYRSYKRAQQALFTEDDRNEIGLDSNSIQRLVLLFQRMNLKKMEPTALSYAFQVFRSANLKVGDGQYFTPWKVVEAGIKLLDITTRDKVADPACGTGGFLSAAYASLIERCHGNEALKAEVRSWAHRGLYGVDRDAINVKLARSIMVGVGDGSTNVCWGDSLRETRWSQYDARLREALHDESFTVVVTNPPFGTNLKITAKEAAANGYTICRHSSNGKMASSYADTELGIVFVERAFRMLKAGGRLGIVLPETYFFSKSYSWFREWLEDRFALRGVLNIPMEAFQGFCRAKTNFYVFEKKPIDGKRDIDVHGPRWFRDDDVWVSYAPTIGINKDGDELFQVDSSGSRKGEIDNKAMLDIEALLSFEETETSHYIEKALLSDFIGVPSYCDDRSVEVFSRYLRTRLSGFSSKSIGWLEEEGMIVVRNGHGSPSADLRKGRIPYIKVSDLRAGLVNPNKTNSVPLEVARSFWKGNSSGLHPYDVITPSRASKNIGEPVVLLPGQEDVVLTKEVLVLSSRDDAPFDNFYLAWAMGLEVVLAQWSRVVFMQTNREDLGVRYKEILLPFPPSRKEADEVSAYVKKYYESLARLRAEFVAQRERER